MPELPDVEVFRRYLKHHALHRRLAGVEVPAPEVLEGLSPQQLGRRLSGQAFQSTRRHGKYLFALVEDRRAVVMHFGMTGSLALCGKGECSPRHGRVLFRFDDGEALAWISQRKIGHVGWTNDWHDYVNARKLGPDADQVSRQEFLQLAGKGGGMVKSWLMNQSRLAGLGNEYSDEILFQCKVHPRASMANLAEADLGKIHKAMGRVIKEAERARVDPVRMPSDFLLPNRHKEGKCPRCDAGVETLKAAGRTAWICPRCQRPPEGEG